MDSKKKLSKYENMWIFAMFDLPVTDKEKRKEYARFRKLLISEGFVRLQYSVYAMFCSSRENAEKYFRHIEQALPPEGEVRMLMTTDKQFEEMAVFYSQKPRKIEKKPEQLLLF